jgi:hypothetical protein
MGLDQYAFTLKNAPKTPVDFDHDNGEEPREIHYWRKHPNLHGWMERLYRRKGGGHEDFNVSALVLDEADLIQLEAAVRANRLPETSGFFFGHSDGDERDDDLEFIAKARAAIAAGRTVFYLAWW